VLFCELLQRIHDAGILHSDIAARNLLVSDTGEPAIIDFGNAVLLDRTMREVFEREMVQLHHVLDQLVNFEKASHD
jgi:serine/threonine protein kinase